MSKLTCVIVGVVLVTGALADQFGDYTYTINSPQTNTITITDYTGTSTDVVIPSNIAGRVVTDIGEEAFKYAACTNLTIPDNVISIGNGSFFGCNGLTSVTIPDSVTSIGTSAFRSCYNLTSVTIPDSVTSIGQSSFRSCYSLTSVTIPDSVTIIGYTAFMSCEALSSVIIGNNVTNIEHQAFYNCDSLMTITVDMQNNEYSSLEGVLFNKSQTTLIQYPSSKFGSYTIPTSVTTIGSQAFSLSQGLTSITIPDSVTHIESSAFSVCDNLITVTIGNSITDIEPFTFTSCRGLTNATIGNSVTNIWNRAFYNCTNLVTVTIPSSVTSLGNDSFGYCSNLKSAYFKGDAPSASSPIFDNANQVIVYYLPDVIGWGATYAGRPAVLWNPQILTDDGNFGVQAGVFGFNIAESESGLVVVESCTNLTDGVWVPVQTHSMSNSTVYFGDPDWINHPGRFYRLSMP